MADNKRIDGDLVVSDVVMPGMSGPEFVAAVTKQRGPLKVIYISGYAEDALRALRQQPTPNRVTRLLKSVGRDLSKE